MRYVVFGGTGFIGTKLCLLLAEGGHKVLCLGRNNPTFNNSNIHFQQIDFHETSSWENLIEEQDSVVDLVTLFISKNTAAITEDLHLEKLKHLVEVCMNKKIKHFLFMSSGGSVYGNGTKPFSENDPTNPVSPYGQLKLKSERLLNSYRDRSDFPLCIARPSNIYGETQSETASVGVITNFYNRILNDVPLDIFGDLEIRKDYLHVDDLVRALVLICNSARVGTYNLGFGQTHTLAQIISKIEAKLMKKAAFNFHPLKNTDIYSYALNCNKARIELGFSAEIDLDEGINRYFQKGLK